MVRWFINRSDENDEKIEVFKLNFCHFCSNRNETQQIALNELCSYVERNGLLTIQLLMGEW